MENMNAKYVVGKEIWDMKLRLGQDGKDKVEIVVMDNFDGPFMLEVEDAPGWVLDCLNAKWKYRDGWKIELPNLPRINLVYFYGDRILKIERYDGSVFDRLSKKHGFWLKVQVKDGRFRSDDLKKSAILDFRLIFNVNPNCFWDMDGSDCWLYGKIELDGHEEQSWMNFIIEDFARSVEEYSLKKAIQG